MHQHSTSAGASVQFTLGEYGVDAILAALAARDEGLPSFVYERLDPLTRLPLTTHIGFRVYAEVVPPRETGDPFDILRQQLDVARNESALGTVFGFIGYPQSPSFRPSVTASEGTPAAVFLRLVDFVTIDHNAIAGTGTGASASATGEGAQFWARFCEQASAEPPLVTAHETAPLDDWHPTVSAEMHAKGVREFQRRHDDNELGGVVLSVQMMSPTRSDALDSYRVLRAINPSTCMFLLQIEGFALWGATSLSLVEIAERHLVAETDGATIRVPERADGGVFYWQPTLKELYEYDVVANALRDDLHTVAAPGTLTFTREREQRIFFKLGHLFAEMQADLADGVDGVGVVQALFPHGATVGHPRAEALGLIDELEWAERGPFSGAIGLFGADGGCDVASVTRSMWTTARGSFAQAGAKVVPASVPHEEYEESVMKTLAVRRSARSRVTRGADHVG